MTKLLNTQRRNIARSMITEAFAEWRHRLDSTEHALAIRLVKEMCGEHVFQQMATLPLDWFPVCSQIGLARSINGNHYVNFNGSTHIPANLLRDVEPPEGWAAEFADYRDLVQAMETERAQLADLIAARLRSITTIERLKEDWPEAHAFLRLPAPVQGLPAIPIDTIRKRIEHAKAA